MPSSFPNGLALFNSGDFFAAHEVLEDLWRATPLGEPIRRHLQGLVQVAVAFHHFATRNLEGSRSVMERGLNNLEGAEDSFPELDIELLRSDLQLWGRCLNENVQDPEAATLFPQPPQIVFRAQPR